MNPYSARLSEFSSFAFNEPDVFKLKGGWQEFFATRMSRPSAKTILEIGCSNSIFLTTIAKKHPESAFVGVDWKFKVLYKGAKRAQDQGLKNLALLRGHAQKLTEMFSKEELDEIWVFFPDPWAKKSQLKNRLVQEKFLLEAWELLKPCGRIHFKTDHPGYFQWVLALFGEPEPELPAYDSPPPEEKGRRTKQIRVRRIERDNLPKLSEKTREAFRFEFSSIDYWRDEKAPQTMFSGVQTEFEKLFVKDSLPIYYVALLKK